MQGVYDSQAGMRVRIMIMAIRPYITTILRLRPSSVGE